MHCLNKAIKKDAGSSRQVVEEIYTAKFREEFDSHDPRAEIALNALSLEEGFQDENDGIGQAAMSRDELCNETIIEKMDRVDD